MRVAAIYALILSVVMSNRSHSEQPPSTVLMDRVGDTGFVRVEARSFATLSARQRELGYWLTQAAIAIDPIAYDQFSRFGLRQKRLLEGIIAHPGSDPAEAKVLAFTQLFWANRGNHNETTSQKFLPDFTVDELLRIAHAARRRGAFSSGYAALPALKTAAALDRELNDLRASLFDAGFETMLTAKSPGPGQDLLQASSNSFYEGVTLADLTGFVETNPLNSRLVKGVDGKLRELIYRAGTADGSVPPGLYAIFLKRANGYLARAQSVAEPVQAKVIGDLMRYYETGNFADWIQYGTDWVQNDATVDFNNGFIEIYRDARGAKGSAQAFVSVTDKPLSGTMGRLAANADYFEAHAPWAAQYKKKIFKAPVVKAVEMLSETGDFGVTTIGDNLPNENTIHEKYGAKNFLIVSSTRALNAATGHRAFHEFAPSAEVAAREERYGDEAEDLTTALHEVIGHGSGQLSDRIKGGSEPYLKEYYSTLEEARADLMALWNVGDPKLKELGLITNQEEVSKAMYDVAVITTLMQLRRIRAGDTLEEDHLRDRQLIANFIQDRVPGSIGRFERDGKSYIQVLDYTKMHEGVGMLLSELMRIKAEGDYTAIKALVDAYGVHFDPKLRDQVLARYGALDLPTYFAGINARLTARRSNGGKLESIQIDYPEKVAEQYLRYASMYDSSLAKAASFKTLK